MRLLLSLLLVAACTKAGPNRQADEVPEPEVTSTAGVAPRFATPPPPQKPVAPKAGVELTSVTLADDCEQAKLERADSSRARGARQNRCEQSSMQLAITASDQAKVTVKSVELLDDKGASLGALTASTPTRWVTDKSAYVMWDGMLARDVATNVSYVLSQPPWDRIGNRWNRTFTLKVVLEIGGRDTSATKKFTVSAPSALPPNVRT